MTRPLPLLETLDQIGAAVETGTHVLVFLDFDGTLAPIVELPDLASLPDPTRLALERLVQHANCTVSIVSGRALDDVRGRVGIEGIVYAGNHGLEISGGGLDFVQSAAVRVSEALVETMLRLSTQVSPIPGVLVEAKGLTASVHYRRVSPGHWRDVARIVRGVVPENHPEFEVRPGKAVWEVRPRVAWNKGSAVRWIRERMGLTRALTFYLGDDRTDEDAFAEVGPFVTARVGGLEPTRAGYRVADTDEVAEFLDWLGRIVQFADPPAAA